MQFILTYHDLRSFFEKRSSLYFENIQEAADATQNIYQLFAFGCILHKKLYRKIQNNIAFEENSFLYFFESFHALYQNGIQAEPHCYEKSLRTYLYLVAENSLLEENVELTKDLAKIMKFEHSHLRVAFFTKNQEIIDLAVQNYNKVYILSEFS